MTLPEVLMVAEKPSIAGSIAAILSKGTHQTRGGKLPVHVFEGDFMGKRVQFKVRVTGDGGFDIGNIGRGSCVQSRFRSRIPELGEDGLLGFVRSEDYPEGGEWRRHSSLEGCGKERVCFVDSL